MFHIPSHKSGTAGQVVNPVPSNAAPVKTLGDYVGHVHAHEGELSNAAPLGRCIAAGECGYSATKMVVDALFGESWVQVVPTDGRPAEFTSYDEAHDFAMQLNAASGLALKIRFAP